MRILGLERTDTRQRLAYRWTGAPFAAPRLLIDEPLTSLETLRHKLEADFFGEPMRPGEFLITVAQNADLNAIRVAFAGLDVVALPGAADALALAEWQPEPLSFADLCDHIEATLIDPLEDSGAAREAFRLARESVSVALIGKSARALNTVYEAVTGAALGLGPRPHTPAIWRESLQGIPITLIDLRSQVVPAALAKLQVIAVASDPGLGQDEAAWLDVLGVDQWVALVNTHTDPRHFADIVAYTQVELGTIPLFDDPDQLGEAVRDWLAEQARTNLTVWVDQWTMEAEPGLDRIRMAVEQFEVIKQPFS